ncbi:putative MFS transporter [Sporormia fimetaria CBS 119925]|uniref:MFS transporter n=1 Tax=Sporormia fimetaria CBS 119925 TaxID=1340428 RepID=A0A6A6V323_9PLEO|nr:putative MFS transporter [Sporormia fimetaria CBS 119925]
MSHADPVFDEKMSSTPVEGSSGKQSAEIQERPTVTLTEEDNKRLRRKTDKWILTILTWVYFLQVLDKGILGTSAVFGLREDTNMTGSQYSLLGSIAPIAQLGWQPFSAWLIVKVPTRILMPLLIFGWGLAATLTCLCHNFAGMMATRFFLGLFEAGCLPLFSIMTGQWYRRVEQPLRLSIWYSMNGTATMAAAGLSYGLGKVNSDTLKTWQIIYLFCGLLTIATAPLAYWMVDNDPSVARFLTPQERLQVVERLKDNKLGDDTEHEFKWSQVWEAALDIKTWLWVILAILPNLGSALPGVFGPLIIKGFGFDSYTTLLLNIPYGAMTVFVVVLACWVANYLRLKGGILAAFMIFPVTGCGMLYGLSREANMRPALLVAYYITSFLFAGNPILISWVVGNTAGHTKRSVTMAFYQAGTSSGALIGPLLFTADQAPEYHPAIGGVLGVFVAMVVLIGVQTLNLMRLNKKQEKRRVANGKPAKILDRSMQKTLNSADRTEQQILDDEAPFVDLTDKENDEFVVPPSAFRSQSVSLWPDPISGGTRPKAAHDDTMYRRFWQPKSSSVNGETGF